MSRERISVIIPVFNRPNRLLRAVQSVFKQEMELELIVVDDGSTSSLQHVKEVCWEHGQRFVRKENGGVSSARNLGIEQSTGDWIAFLDSDDEWLPGKLSSQIEYHVANPDILISQTDEIWIRNGKRVNRKKYHQFASGESFELCCDRCAISPSSVMMKRSLLESVGTFDETFSVCEDFELWLRISARHPIGFIPKPLIQKYGGHEDQLSRSRPALDGYRLRALLLFASREPLSPEQQEIVQKQIKQKSEILLIGAQKGRGRWQDQFELIYQNVQKVEVDEEGRKFQHFAAEALPIVGKICEEFDCKAKSFHE